MACREKTTYPPKINRRQVVPRLRFPWTNRLYVCKLILQRRNDNAIIGTNLIDKRMDKEKT